MSTHKVIITAAISGPKCGNEPWSPTWEYMFASHRLKLVAIIHLHARLTMAPHQDRERES